MTGDHNDGFERPFEMEGAPELSRLSDVQEWKQPDMDNRMQYWEEELPFAPTGWTQPVDMDPGDWW